jgi:hypothetical protein
MPVGFSRDDSLSRPPLIACVHHCWPRDGGPTSKASCPEHWRYRHGTIVTTNPARSKASEGIFLKLFGQSELNWISAVTLPKRRVLGRSPADSIMAGDVSDVRID